MGRTRIIAVGNSKGGVGKTTTVVNLGHGLSLAGKKVLAVDLDSQGNLAPVLGIKPGPYLLYHVLIEGKEPTEVITPARKNGKGHFDILPGNWLSAKAKDILTGAMSRETTLARQLRGLRGYDYVLLDCAPSLDLLNVMALLYANEVLIPVGCRGIDLYGVRQYLDVASQIRQTFNHPLSLLAILPTFYDQRTTEAKAVLAKLREHYKNIVASPIRLNVRLMEAGVRGRTIFEYDRDSYGAHDYAKLVELIARGVK